MFAKIEFLFQRHMYIFERHQRKDCRNMVNVLEKEIRLCKEEIYKAQNSYSNRKK